MGRHAGDESTTPVGEEPTGAQEPEREAASGQEGVAGGAGGGGLAAGAARGVAGLGTQEFVVLTEHEAPPEELTPAQPRGTAMHRGRKAWMAAGIAAGVLGVGLIAWTTPGAGAFENQAGVLICSSGLPLAGSGHDVEFRPALKNLSSLPVTVTGASIQRLGGAELVRAGAQVSSGGPEILGAFAAEPQRGVTLGSGESVEVPPGRWLILTLTVRPTATSGQWNATAADVSVDYHAWTQAPQRSVDSTEYTLTTGQCPG